MSTVLTTSSTPIIGQVAWVMGLLMQGIYWVIGKLGIPNVGLAIIIFTVILLMLMMPLQIKQQRFSKLTNIMQPELKKIQNKYKNKKDQVSQQRMMEETNAVYAKYGVSQMGSCVQMLIQIPVLFALYRVIYQIPGYITTIGDRIRVIAENESFVAVFKEFVEGQGSTTLTQHFSKGTTNNIIDAVYGLSTKQWEALETLVDGKDFQPVLTDIHNYISGATKFFGLNISDTPWDIIKNAVTDKPSFWILLVIAALLFPILAWATQMLTIKLMPQPAATTGDDENPVANSMQSVNTFMPLMSAFFCFTLPVGVGIYWIMSAVVRAIQQFFVNRHLDKETPEEIIKAAQEKANKKRAKQGLPPQKITEAAHVSTRSLENERSLEEENRRNIADRAHRQAQASTEYYNQNVGEARPGSLASKANMVKAFNEKNGRKK